MAIGHCNEISRLHRTRCFDRLNRVGRGGLDSARQMRERNTTQQVRQLRDIHRDPARLVFAEQLGLNGRFTPKSGRRWARVPCPLCARSGPMHCSKETCYSISSASHGESLCLRNLDDWPRSANRRPGRFLPFQNIGEADAIILGRDCLEPMTHIAPEHERI